MSKNDVYLTPEGAEKLRLELDELVNVKRPALSSRLRQAIAMGDLSENADYIIAKEEQAFLEGKIQELEATLRNATLIAKTGKTEIVSLGNVVRISAEDDEVLEFRIVGAKEADPPNGKISNESPIGQALLGKRKGDRAIASTPGGELAYTILEILGG